MDALSAIFQAILGEWFKQNPVVALYAIQQALLGLGEDAWKAFAGWYEERRQEGWPEVPQFPPTPLPINQNPPDADALFRKAVSE